MAEDEVEVRCYSGHTYAERPVSFRWQDKDYQVEKIESSWREPGEIHFWVRIRDNLFHLCYNEVLSKWTLVSQRSKRGST